MDRSMRKKILVAGAVNIDRFYSVPSLESLRNLPWWPRTGERMLPSAARSKVDLAVAGTAILRTHVGGGGQAANFAIAAAECDVDVALFASVGIDPLAPTALADLGQVDIRFVQRHGRTSEALIFVDSKGQRDILLFLGEDMPEPEPHIFGDDSYDHIHLTSLASKEGIQRQRHILEIFPKSTRRSLDIGALYASIGYIKLADVLQELDILFATEAELENFTGISLKPSIDLLLEHGVKAVCCKQGPAGAALYESNGNFTKCNAPEVDVVDTTGAGDVLAAIFIAASLHGRTLPEALEIATALASNSVTAWGRTAYPNKGIFRAALDAV
jgi:ribokinase